jgi:hypothetical protein
VIQIRRVELLGEVALDDKEHWVSFRTGRVSRRRAKP